MVNELKRRFQQKRGMPVVAAIEKLLLDAANGTMESMELPEEILLYKNDLDLTRLKVQLPMLPDAIRVRNQKCTKQCAHYKGYKCSNYIFCND